jgi:hypothetical protein
MNDTTPKLFVKCPALAQILNGGSLVRGKDRAIIGGRFWAKKKGSFLP